MASITNVPIGSPRTRPQLAGLFSQDHVQTPYGEYTVTTTYVADSGNRAIPIAKGDNDSSPSVAIVKLHAKMVTKILEWSVSRTGAKPVLPSFTTNDPNLAQLNSTYSFADPPPAADGLHRTYAAAGRYVYACRRPVEESSGFKLTFPPYQQSANESFAGSDFSASFVA